MVNKNSCLFSVTQSELFKNVKTVSPTKEHLLRVLCLKFEVFKMITLKIKWISHASCLIFFFVTKFGGLMQNTFFVKVWTHNNTGKCETEMKYRWHPMLHAWNGYIMLLYWGIKQTFPCNFRNDSSCPSGTA